MGCFTVLKRRKKKTEKTTSFKHISPKIHLSTSLPEPQIPARSLHSAPPSFKTRVKPAQPVKKHTNNRTRTLSAPSTLDAADQDALSECEDQEDLKYRPSPSPQPLPLPSAQGANMLKNMGSFKKGSGSGPLYTSGPLPLPPLGHLRNFSFEEIAVACHNFSPDSCVSEGLSSVIYKALFEEDLPMSKKPEATVTSLRSSTQGIREFVNEVNTLSSLHHPNLCKLIGFHAREGSDQRMLVYDRLCHGSLDQVLYGRSDGPPIDWNTRMKIALCTARGLTFLHEEGPFQAMYSDFSSTNIQIDKDFSAKLSGYGCVSHVADTEISNNSAVMANLSIETLERGLLTPKSNVWSFGVILLELLTGRKSYDHRHPKEERNLVKWSRPFLADDCRLSLIMDPQLKGRFPVKAARTIADIAHKCLQKDPSERPTMRRIVDHLKTIQDMKYSCRYPLQEPARNSGKYISKSSSFNGIVITQSPPPAAASRARNLTLYARPLSLPPRTCSSSNLCLVKLERQESQNSYSSTGRRSSVEGY